MRLYEPSLATMCQKDFAQWLRRKPTAMVAYDIFIQKEKKTQTQMQYKTGTLFPTQDQELLHVRLAINAIIA